MDKHGIFTDDFINSINDYFYFLNRYYPYKPVLKIVGDKYRLSGIQRSVLFRGIINKKTASERKEKLITLENQITNQVLNIDTYNVLITIGSYLNGNFIYYSNDGFLRDTAESHGKLKKLDYIYKALFYLIEYLDYLKPGEIKFIIDSPVSHSKILSNEILKRLESKNINGTTELIKSADYKLIMSEKGISATSDSAIVDKKDRIFDLANFSIKYHFSPGIILLEKFLN